MSGYKFLPEVATPEMKEAGMEISPMRSVGGGKRASLDTDEAGEVYRAMVEAAPDGATGPSSYTAEKGKELLDALAYSRDNFGSQEVSGAFRDAYKRMYFLMPALNHPNMAVLDALREVVHSHDLLNLLMLADPRREAADARAVASIGNARKLLKSFE